MVPEILANDSNATIAINKTFKNTVYIHYLYHVFSELLCILYNEQNLMVL